MAILVIMILAGACSKKTVYDGKYRILKPQDRTVTKIGEILTPCLDHYESVISLEYFLNDSLIFSTMKPDSICRLRTAGLEPGNYALSSVVHYVGRQVSRDRVFIDVVQDYYGPKAAFESSMNTGSVNTIFYLDPRKSADRDNPTASLKMRWDFGDGRVWDGGFRDLAPVNHRYSQPGSYRVLLRVRDRQMQVDTCSIHIEVASASLYSPSMILVKGSTYLMGKGAARRDTVISVTLPDYFIGRYEVTNREFVRFLNSGIYSLQPDKLLNMNETECGIGYEGQNYIVKKNGHPDDGREAAAEITWLGAVAYCNWISAIEGLTPVYLIKEDTVHVNKSADGYRLPLESEWEYAARGGRQGRNTEYSGSDNLDQVGWYVLNSSIYIQPVGLKKANELGIYDMSGNVSEWCFDQYGRFGRASAVNPLVAGPGAYRVVRGGAVNSMASFCTVTSRSRSGNVNGLKYVGFRMARNAVSK